ncbi:MAG: chitobiase/beta-hexosaminidase C-terminal domain-containing protein [Kiritimatiellae bacterium]|nr:chitobiase/beta-hexosaminidase C-terminal domain-containing protein [Kiritimatiellia bacterium]
MKLSTMLAVAFGAMLAFAAEAGSLSVSPYFQSHMVFQRGKPLTVWGKDAAGRTVTVSFGGRTANAVTGSDGLWEATFAQPFSLSSVSQTLTVSDNASESVSLSDILVGDVYLCAGQSNMHFMLWEDNDAVKNFCSAAGDGVRAIHVPENQSNSAVYDLPQTTSYDKFGTGWGSCATEVHRRNITSVGLNFACYLRAANPGIPIGIVQAAFRGSSIDIWRVGHTGWNAMIAPYAKAQFCGVLWYQGESNAGMTADAYAAALHALADDWRTVWGSDLPFYAVQIATPGPYYGASVTDAPPAPTTVGSQWNYTSIREGLRLWNESETGKHGLVVICDFAECLQNNDLHPHDKNTVGRRLSLFALRDIYGQTALQANGPKYDAAVVNADGSVTVSFKPGTATGLTAGKVIQCSGTTVSSWTSTTDPIKGFALKGADGVWRAATATVSGSTVVLTANGISAGNKAVQFHYGYWNLTRDNTSNEGQRMTLYNAAGLPLSPIAPQTLTGGTIPDDPPIETVATPSFTPASCTFYPTANVTLSCATSGATVRYTLDGSAPTESSAGYTGPIAISATTTVKARAFATGKNPSAVASATYALVNPGTPGQTWTTCEFSPSTWSPLANNMLLGNAGTLTGTKSFLTSDIAKITDGTIPSSNAQVSDTFGFAKDATVDWTFDGPKTLEKIRFTSCYIAGSGMYDDIKIAKIAVKAAGSDAWIDLGVEPLNYAGSGAANTALSATVEDDAAGFLAQNATALRVTFGQQNNVAQYYAEIEAVGTAAGVAPVATVADPTFSPASCTFYPAASVTLSCTTAGATIRYTLDGSEPTDSSAAYTGPIAISATTTVKARAFAADMNPSAIASATFTYTEPVTPGPLDYPPVSTNATWTASACAPASWTALGDNVLAGLTGSIVGQVATGYSTNDPDLLTDGAVPTAGGKDWIVGLTINSSISWTFAAPKTLDSVRVSCGYLAGPLYSGFTVSKVEVQTAGSAEWTTVSAAAGQMANNGQADILSLVLADGSGAPLAVNASALKVTFAAPPIGFANYCAEIEAVERTEGGVIDPPEPPATYSIAIAAAENGTLETSVTNGIAAGTTVTVTATPNDGCSLVSVTVDGAAISGNTFTMPSANVTLAATFEEDELPPSPPPSGDKVFYIGETGYDSWADVYAAANNGDTIVVGKDASFAISGGKTITIDLAGRSLEWEGSGWMYGSLTVVDILDGGHLALSGYSRNVCGGTVDLSSLSGSQLTGTGKFYVNASTVLRFPGDMTLADCTSRIGNVQNGLEIVAEGVTYVYDGSGWSPQGRSYPSWLDTSDRTSVAKYDAWATKFDVSDASTAMEDAYLFNCANTTEAVSAAKAAFHITGVTYTANGVMEIGMPVAPEGGFNGTVTILGCETINGTYHAAEPTDRFFKAVLGK